MIATDFLIYANTLGVFVALITLLWAAPKVGKPLNITLIGASMLSAVFLGAYVLLIAGVVTTTSFLVIVRWAGIFTWPVVWIAPAIGLVKWKRNAGQLIREASRPENVITPIKGVDIQVPLNRDDYSE